MRHHVKVISKLYQVVTYYSAFLPNDLPFQLRADLCFDYVHDASVCGLL